MSGHAYAAHTVVAAAISAIIASTASGAVAVAPDAPAQVRAETTASAPVAIQPAATVPASVSQVATTSTYSSAARTASTRTTAAARKTVTTRKAATTATTAARRSTAPASRTISRYVDAPGSQSAINRCNLVLWTHHPLWLAAHNYCGYQWLAYVPTGTVVTVRHGAAAGTYVVTGHLRLTRQSGSLPRVRADLVLQTCIGHGTGLTLARRIH